MIKRGDPDLGITPSSLAIEGQHREYRTLAGQGGIRSGRFIGSRDLPPPFVPLFKLELSSFLDCTWSPKAVASPWEE